MRKNAYLCQLSHPIGGVSARPLSSACTCVTIDAKANNDSITVTSLTQLLRIEFLCFIFLPRILCEWYCREKKKKENKITIINFFLKNYFNRHFGWMNWKWMKICLSVLAFVQTSSPHSLFASQQFDIIWIFPLYAQYQINCYY